MSRLQDWPSAVAAGFLLFVLGAAAAPAQDLTVDLELAPAGGVGLEELATLSITVTSPDSHSLEPEAKFEIDNFRIRSGPSRSPSLRIANDTSSISVTLSWRLQPIAVGKARVHSATVRIGEEVLELPSREVVVLEKAPPERSARRRERIPPFLTRDSIRPNLPLDSFLELQRRRRRRRVEPPKIYLRAEAQPQNPYVGQQVLYTVYLFTEADVRSIKPRGLPVFKGFWVRSIPQPDQLEPQMVTRDGDRIGRVVLMQRALFARRSGSFEIAPATALLAALVPDSGPSGSLLPRTREITRESNRVTLTVRPLPPPPAGFQGAVGELEIEAELSPDTLEVGDAATLSLTLRGKGHFQGLPIPLLPELPGIRVFPPQQQSHESVRRKNVTGERTWSFVLVPERPGKWELPAIEVPYFDPRREAYRTATTQRLELEVRASSRHPQAGGQTAALHPIRTAVLPAIGSGGGSRAQPWLFGLPWGLLAAVLWRRRRRRRSSGGGGHRLEHGHLLMRLRRADAEERPRQAAAEIEEAWREFLHRRWGLPQGSASTRWETLLAAAGVAEKVARELVELADDLHYLRYAPMLSSTSELRRDLIERSRKLARAVDG